MNTTAISPDFKSFKEYKAWKIVWKETYKRLSQLIRAEKNAVKNDWRFALNEKQNDEAASRQRNLHFHRATAFKMMNLLKDADERLKKMRALEEQMRKQNESFPLSVECREIIFHFNKLSLVFPNIVPPWIVKVKGQSYYINSLNFNGVTGTTKESPDHPSTQGAIRFRHCTIHFLPSGDARLEPLLQKMAA